MPNHITIVTVKIKECKTLVAMTEKTKSGAAQVRQDIKKRLLERPRTASELQKDIGLSRAAVYTALVGLEAEGELAMQKSASGEPIVWEVMRRGITLDWLYRHVVEQDGHLIWNGYCGCNGKGPQARIDGKAVSVRRAMWELIHERKIPTGLRAGSGCEVANCVHPDHLIVRQVKMLLRGHKRQQTEKAAIAKNKRAKSKWSQEVIESIRTSDEPARVEAERHGMNLSYVYYIRNNKLRKNFSNPFAGLGARAEA